MYELDKVAQGIIKPINAYGTLILGLFTLSWGIWIGNPFWDAFQQATLYHRAHELAPEWAWGAWSAFSGIAILHGLWRGRYRVWVSALGFAVWHWWTIAGMLWWGDWKNTGGLTYTFVAIYTTYAWLNMRINREHFDPPHLR